ncbi:hypothetical protein C9J85_04565 [Haloferax sp. wsp5]|nr:hypothetical protein C9J85_04565 [Haloferax sp. wsp5]
MPSGAFISCRRVQSPARRVSDLPAPETLFVCDDCGAERSLSEFMRTTRDLEVLQEFTDS